LSTCVETSNEKHSIHESFSVLGKSSIIRTGEMVDSNQGT